MHPIFVLSSDPQAHSVWTHLLQERGYLVRMQHGQGVEEEQDFLEDPSLVIFDLDARTPLTAAWSTLERLRTEFPSAPLIILLPPSLPDGYRRLFANGANGCLQKPVDCGVLLRLVDMFVVRQDEKRRIEIGISRMLSLNPA